MKISSKKFKRYIKLAIKRKLTKLSKISQQQIIPRLSAKTL